MYCSFISLRRSVASLFFFAAALHAAADSAHAATLVFSWDPSPESDIVGYRVAYGSNPDGYSNVVEVGTVPRFVLPNLSPGQTVYFAVQSQNTAGLTSAYSTLTATVGGSAPGAAPPAPPSAPASSRPVNVIQRGDCADWDTKHSDPRKRKVLSNMLRLRSLAAVNDRPILRIYTADGQLRRTQRLQLRARTQLLYNLNGRLPEGQVGSVCVEHAAPLSGNLLSTFEDRNRRAPRRVQFAFSVPLGGGFAGDQIVPFNTYQPTRSAAELPDVVANWLSIRNAGTVAGSGAVILYDLDGTYRWAFPVTLQPGQRFDMDLHRLGQNLAGSALWKPNELDVPFVIRNVRYFHDNPFFANSFLAAVPLEARGGGHNPSSLAVNTVGRLGVMELSNPLPIPLSAVVTLFAADGSVARSLSVDLASSSSRHLVLNELLGDNSTGRVAVQGSIDGVIAMAVLAYRYGPSGGLVEATASAG